MKISIENYIYKEIRYSIRILSESERKRNQHRPKEIEDTWGVRNIPINGIIEVFDEDQRKVLTDGPDSKAKVEVEFILWLLTVLWCADFCNLCSGSMERGRRYGEVRSGFWKYESLVLVKV